MDKSDLGPRNVLRQTDITFVGGQASEKCVRSDEARVSFYQWDSCTSGIEGKHRIRNSNGKAASTS